MHMLGARIAALRREAGMKQSELARRLRVSPSAVGMYEQGRREPSAELLLEISRVFGVSMEYLVAGTPREEEQQRLDEMLQSRIAAADQKLQSRRDRPFSRQELAVLFAALLMEE